MKCLRIYSTADGESHFDEVEIPTSSRQVHPNATAFEVSAAYTATRIRFTSIPSGAQQVDWHTVPERVLTVRLASRSGQVFPEYPPRHLRARAAGQGGKQQASSVARLFSLRSVADPATHRHPPRLLQFRPGIQKGWQEPSPAVRSRPRQDPLPRHHLLSMMILERCGDQRHSPFRSERSTVFALDS
jgi:hypothetical protein